MCTKCGKQHIQETKPECCVPFPERPTMFCEAEDAVRVLLKLIGEDASREGLHDTPKRVAKALREMTDGYRMDPAEILATQFEVGAVDEMVILRCIRFTSMCEHHMLPFVGEAAVGYLPGEKVVGLSKLARLVECFSKRLQVQERLTNEIAQAVLTHCQARGVGVVIKAHHACMGCRGARQPDAEMVTSSMLGMFRDDQRARTEFLTLIG